MGYFIYERLGLAPGNDQIDQRGHDAYQQAMQQKMRFDPAINSKGEQKWHQQGRGKNGRQEARLPKEMENWEDDCEYCQFCGHAAHQHSSPTQAAQNLPVDCEFI